MFKTEPVDIRTFIHDPYYLGATCRNTLPKLVEDLEEIFYRSPTTGNRYSECALTGAVGWGKSWMASIGVCRMLYEVSCLENPQAALWLGENQNISVPILGPIQSVAERTATAVIAKIDKSPYFTEKFPYTHKTGSSDWQFPNNVWIPARTYETTAVLGLNSIGAYADELCLLRGAASGDLSAARAEMIYNAIAKRTHRLKQCPIASLTFAVSSTWNLGSRIVPRKLREAEDPENGVFARSYSLWGPRPKEFYGDSTFSVLVGRSGIPSKILTPAEVPLVRSILPTSRIIEVPEDFRREFERDLNGSLKDLAGEGLDAVS